MRLGRRNVVYFAFYTCELLSLFGEMSICAVDGKRGVNRQCELQLPPVIDEAFGVVCESGFILGGLDGSCYDETYINFCPAGSK